MQEASRRWVMWNRIIIGVFVLSILGAVWGWGYWVGYQDAEMQAAMIEINSTK